MSLGPAVPRRASQSRRCWFGETRTSSAPVELVPAPRRRAGAAIEQRPLSFRPGWWAAPRSAERAGRLRTPGALHHRPSNHLSVAAVRLACIGVLRALGEAAILSTLSAAPASGQVMPPSVPACAIPRTALPVCMRDRFLREATDLYAALLSLSSRRARRFWHLLLAAYRRSVIHYCGPGSICIMLRAPTPRPAGSAPALLPPLPIPGTPYDGSRPDRRRQQPAGSSRAGQARSASPAVVAPGRKRGGEFKEIPPPMAVALLWQQPVPPRPA